MASNLCSSPSSIHDHQTLCSLSSRSKLLQITPFTPIRIASSSLKLSSVSLLTESISLQAPRVSLHDPITQQFQTPKSTIPSNSQNTEGKTTSSKNYIWVNPRSSRAPQLRKKSYDARYTYLVNVSETLNSCDSNEDDVYKVLSGLGHNVVEQDAVIVLNNMRNPATALLALQYFQRTLKLKREVILYNVAMKVLKKHRDLDSAQKLFDEMTDRGVKPDNITFSTIISCARSCSLPEKAVEWFEKMPAFQCNPDDVTYSAMIDAYGRAGNVDKALSLYDRARAEKWRIDVVTFSTLIKTYGKSGNFDGCLNVYEEMKALGVKPNLVIYNALLDSMGRAKRPWQAKNIFKDMTDNGVLPSWGSYAALLRAFCRARYGEDALNIYNEMKEKGMELNVILYNTLLAMCADVGYSDEAADILKT
ncbi:hypothetical protein Nepgr_028698 [Nepenthes gracilis]|uniref:PROP1-like PPR domain-containing protein n=1 Tax=Nepenthes gracilis TaxID=150966 RepID=A0AAD3TAT7_NEPGR|nr:hypothetical protein Nepgr_028698 [Nepenthes gracilis]